MLIKPPPRDELQAAYASAACPICTLLTKSERRYIDITLYEHVTDTTWRAEVRAARGFCTLHTERVLTIGRSALGASLVAGDILKTLRTQALNQSLGGGAFGRLRAAFGSGGGLAALLRPQQPCPLCAYLADLGKVYVAALLSDLQTGDGAAQYEESRGLCIPHLIMAAEHGGPGLQPLLDHQARAWQQLEAELEEFARKQDYRYRDEQVGSEADAWQRAWRLLVGR
jgi:hypothetical protein